MIRLSSEIQKYYWQDFSLQRLIAMPAVMAAIIWLINLIKTNHVASSVATFASIGFFPLVFIWGGYRAASCVIEEIQGNTWDNQRLSSVSPWQLSLGKLFGSTLYPWYGGLLALAIYVVAGVQEYPTTTLYNAMLWLLAGLFCHAVALLVSMQALRTQNRYGKYHPILYLIFALIASQVFYGYGSVLSEAARRGNTMDPVQWYGQEFSASAFIFLSLCAFFLWAVVGVYRMMREELKFRNTPFVWGAFVVFLMTYISGFIYIRTDFFESLGYGNLLSQSRLGVAFIIGMSSAYAMLLFDTLTITRYRILCHQWRRKQWRKLLETLPMWVMSVALSALVAVLFVSYSLAGSKASVSIVFTLGVFLFLLRDICILHYFTFVPGSKRAVAATAFYLAILYSLLPSIFMAANQFGTLSLFYPAISGKAVDLLPQIAEAAVACLVLRARYRHISRQVDSAV